LYTRVKWDREALNNIADGVLLGVTHRPSLLSKYTASQHTHTRNAFDGLK